MRKTLIIALLICGCSDDGKKGPELLPGFTPPPAPTNGFQIILPIQRNIQPGSDNEICTWTDVIAKEDMDIKTVEAFQSETGHHVVIYSTSSPQPAWTTHDCSGADTVNFRFAAGSGGEGQGMRNTAPGNLVYRIAKGSQIVINHHYLNATGRVMDAQSAINAEFADPGTTHVPSSSLAFINTGIHIPPNNTGAADINCTMQRDLNTWFFIPHMHRWGQHIVVEKTQVGMTTSEKLFDLDWNPEYTFHPPEIRRDPSTPFALKAGDQIHVHCDWNNDTAQTLTFGLEMCVSFAAIIDDSNIGNLVCDDGQWGTF